ncbi:Endonuclease-reverse transcriptase [Lotmaria passim]
MPATSTWCYGPVHRFQGGSQEPAYFAFVRCRAAHGIGSEVKGGAVLGCPGTRSMSALPYRAYTRPRVVLTLMEVAAMCRLLLLLSGDIELNPGPTIGSAQWNARELLSKQAWLEKHLMDGQVASGFVVETSFTPDRCLSFHVDGYNRCGYATPSGAGGVSIFVQGGIPYQLGEAKLHEELQVVTLDILLGRGRLCVVAAYFPKSRLISDHSLAALSRCLPSGYPVVLGMDANAHHPEWEATYRGDAGPGNYLAAWRAEGHLLLANNGDSDLATIA